LLQSRTEEAIVWLEKARIGNPGSPWPHTWLASAYGLKGDLDRAAAELAEARRLLGGRAYPSIAAMRADRSTPWGVYSVSTAAGSPPAALAGVVKSAARLDPALVPFAAPFIQERIGDRPGIGHFGGEPSCQSRIDLDWALLGHPVAGEYDMSGCATAACCSYAPIRVSPTR
jgi:hypothetical protein